MQNQLKLPEIMLFIKYLIHIGMKVSNDCSITVLVCLYPSCFQWTKCYFGKRHYVVKTLFFMC